MPLSVTMIEPGDTFSTFASPYYGKIIDATPFIGMWADIHVLSMTGTSLVVNFEAAVIPTGGNFYTIKSSSSISSAGKASVRINPYQTAADCLGYMRVTITFTSITALQIRVSALFN